MMKYIKMFSPTILLVAVCILSFGFAGTPLFIIPVFITLFTSWVLSFFPSAGSWALEFGGGFFDATVPTNLGWIVGGAVIIGAILLINYLIVYLLRKL